MAKAKINMDALRLSQKTLNVGDNGDMFMVSDTNGTTQNVKNWTNMNNIVDVPIDVPKQVDDVVSKWDFVTKEILGPNGQKTISENPRLNDAYQNAKENLIGSIVDESNPSSVVSVLLDNSNLGYQTYFTGEDVTSLVEKAAKIQEAKDKKQMTPEEAKTFAENYKKNNLIELVLNNDGEIMPVVTPKMIVDARGVAESQIEEQLGWKEQVERGFAPGGGDDGGGGGSTAKNDYTLYKSMADAWASGDRATLNSLLKNKRYSFEYRKTEDGKTESRLIQKNKNEITGAPEPVEVYPYTSNLSDLIPYFFGTGASAIAKGEKQRQLWLQNEGGNAGPKQKAY
jgi:hypothetical protein